MEVQGYRTWTITGTGTREVFDGDEVIERGTPVVTSGPQLDPFERVRVVPADLHQGAVEALRNVYDRYHLVGDGGAGQISGDALRALGIDPDHGD